MEFSPEYWASHRRGSRKRNLILSVFQEDPNAKISKLMEVCQLSEKQVRRHLTRLRQDGKLPLEKI